MRRGLATIGIIAGLVLVPWAAAVEADTRLVISVRPAHGHGQARHFGHHHFRGHQLGHQHFRHHDFHHRHFGHHHLGHHNHALKTIVVVPSAPVYYGPRPSGYWTYHWVPQWAHVQVWVPGGWSHDGRWVEAHYETRWTDYGSWQPYWVPY
jgi:hypothetical protein